MIRGGGSHSSGRQVHLIYESRLKPRQRDAPSLILRLFGVQQASSDCAHRLDDRRAYSKAWIDMANDVCVAGAKKISISLASWLNTTISTSQNRGSFVRIASNEMVGQVEVCLIS